MSNHNITTEQKAAKAKFWNRVKDNPMRDAASMSDADIADIIGDITVKLWLRDAKFKAWFLDDKILHDLLTLGAEAAVKRLIAIVNETDVGPREAVSTSSQVAAAKILLDFAGMSPIKKTETTIKADDLPNDEKALREYIERNAKKLRVLDAE